MKLLKNQSGYQNIISLSWTQLTDGAKAHTADHHEHRTNHDYVQNKRSRIQIPVAFTTVVEFSAVSECGHTSSDRVR